MRFLYSLAFILAVVCFSMPSLAARPGMHASEGAPDHAVTNRPARTKVPPLKEMGGQEVDTEYFKLVIPKGWSMPVPPKSTDAGMTVVFASMEKSPGVSISLIKTNMGAREIGEGTLANMKKGGIPSTPLEEKNGLWHATLSGKAKGDIWFGSADGVAAVTNIIGTNVEKANTLLEAINPKIKGILPTSAQ